MARRVRRWIWRSLIALVGLVVLAVILVLVALANLDAGPVKSLIQGQARGFGLALDYDDGSVTLGALRFRNLRLLSTEADAALAPELMRIGAIDGKISLLSLRGDDLVIRDVAITVVVDEDGSTSLDRVLAKLPPSEPDTTPLSQLAEALLPDWLVADAHVENVTLTVIPRTPKAGERMQLTGLVASATVGESKASARLGPSELRFVLGEKEAVAKLDAQVNVANRAPLTATLSLELVRQNLAPALPPVKKVVDLGVIVDFVPAEKRTRVRLERLALLDGAARVEATAEIPDDVAQGPVVRSASCRLDLVALARAVPAEYGPVTVEAEPITCSARDLELLPAPRGQLTLSGAIAKLAWRDLSVEGAKLDVSARPNGGALQAKVALAAESLKMEGLAVTGAALDVDTTGAKGGWPLALKGNVAAATVVTPTENVRDARVAFDGTLRGPKSLDLKAIIDAASVAAGGAVTTRPHLEATLAGFELADEPVLSTGQVTVTGTVAQIVQPKGPRLDDVDLALDARLAGSAPSSARLRLNARQLAIPGGGRDFPPAPLALTVDASRLALADPAKIRGEAKLDVTFGAATVAGTVAGGMDDATWDLTGKAARLGPARTVAFTSKGRYAGAIEQDTTVEVGRVATGDASLRGARIHLTSSGNARRHEATIAAALDEVVVGGKSVGSPKIDLVAALDRGARPHVELTLKGQTPDVDLRLVADIDEKRTVRWEAKGRAAKLASLAPLLPEGPSWKDVTVEIDGKGVASGVVKSVQDGVPVLVADPARTARGRQTLSLAVHDFHYQGAAETRADAGALAVRAVVDLGQPHKATIDVDAPRLSAVASGVHAQVEGLDINLVAEADRRGVGKADLTLRAKKIEQTAFASYPVRDLELTAGVHGDPATALSIRAQLTNAGAGTRFELSGELDQRAEPGADAVIGRQSLAVDGKIEQSLDALTGAPDRLRAKGKVSVPFRVESGDLQLFQARATLNLDGVSVELPADGIAVSDVNGSLPVVQEIVLGPDGAEMVGSGARGVYPQVRFGDQSPFLGGEDFLSIGGLRVGDKRYGPLAGNARVDRDVVALDQLELTALGGKITGQVLALVRGKDTRVDFRGKVTGVRPTAGDERLDASAAIGMTPYRLGLEGRIEIVRISKRHLLDLLDVWDPYHADVSANRVRLGLKIGYPKQVRLHFAHGFASLAVELGGLAGAVRIDEIKGIPIGPAMARFLAPVLAEDKK